MANIILSKESSNNELKCYFEAVLKLSQSDNQFPINLNDVWMLAYSEKGKAVRALKTNFIENIDFSLAQNGKQTIKQGRGGHNEETYLLSPHVLNTLSHVRFARYLKYIARYSTRPYRRKPCSRKAK